MFERDLRVNGPRAWFVFAASKYMPRNCDGTLYQCGNQNTNWPYDVHECLEVGSVFWKRLFGIDKEDGASGEIVKMYDGR